VQANEMRVQRGFTCHSRSERNAMELFYMLAAEQD